MRVAWFTPFGPASAIGEFSDHVTRALAERSDVELWLADARGRRQTPLPVCDYAADPTLLADLAERDLVVYNLGDHLGYHSAIYDAAQHHAGVVLLHDRIYQHLVVPYWVARGEAYRLIERAELLYGPEGRRFLEDLLLGRRQADRLDDPDLLRFSFAEELLVGSRGAIVHSPGQADWVRARMFGPVTALPFPAYPPAGAGAAPAGEADGRFRLVTVGYVNANKQVDRVVRVLADDPELAARVRYVVVGPYDPAGAYWSELQNLIDERELASTVQLLGYRPDSELAALMAAADAFVNLRYPALEGASASLMQELALGKPVVVNATGSFAELPPAAVLLVAPDDDAQLRDALRTVVFDDEARQRLAAGARRVAELHTLDRYAEQLLEFAEEVRSWSPILALCDRVGAELSALGLDAGSGVVDVVAEQLAPLVAAEPAFRRLWPEDESALADFLTRNDVPAVTGFFDPFPFDASTAADIAGATGEDRFYGAFAGDRLVALSMLRGWDEGYEVPSFGVAVDAEWHGRGLGSRLTDWTIEQARELGSPAVRLSVYGRNEVARGIYERRGFRELSREKIERNGASDERIVMVKELDAAAARVAR